jgi:quercetin dioxygenase-like cupin family protein
MYLASADAKTTTLDNGVVRTIMAHNDELMIVRFEFRKGQIGEPHAHEMHTQSTYILSGKFEFTVDGQSYICQPGDTLLAAHNAVHGCVCLEDGVLIDNFTPQRDDFLE